MFSKKDKAERNHQFQKCKLTNDSPSPDTAKRKDSKFKKSVYSLAHLNIQDDKTQHKDLLIPENTGVIKVFRS